MLPTVDFRFTEADFETRKKLYNLNILKETPNGILLETTVINRAIQNDCQGGGVINYYSPVHFFLQMQLPVISFYGVTSRISFMFLLFI
jgi:hypothetical protein